MSWHELVVRMKSAVKKLGMRDSKNFGVQNESFKGEWKEPERKRLKKKRDARKLRELARTERNLNSMKEIRMKDRVHCSKQIPDLPAADPLTFTESERY